MYFIFTALFKGLIATCGCCSGHLKGKGDQTENIQGTKLYVLYERHT